MAIFAEQNSMGKQDLVVGREDYCLVATMQSHNQGFKTKYLNEEDTGLFPPPTTSLLVLG